MTEKIQNLDYQLIERASEKYKNIREAVIMMEVEGKVESFVVEIYKHFAPVQITACIQELIEKIDIIRLKDSKGYTKIIVPYLIFLIIKHFTTLNLPNKYDQQLAAIEHMTNTGTMLQIFMHMDENEIQKLKDEFMYVIDNFNSKEGDVEEIKEQVKSLLVDKTLME